MSHNNFIAISKDEIQKIQFIRLYRGSFLQKLDKEENNIILSCVCVIVKTDKRPTCSGINEPARIALYLANEVFYPPDQEFEVEIGRASETARGTDKGDRDSRVRQFPYPVSAKEARSREEEEVKRREEEEEEEEDEKEIKDGFVPLYPSAYLPPLNLCIATPEEESRIRRGCRIGPYGIFGRVAQKGKSAPFLTPCGSGSRKMSTRRSRLICNRNCQILVEDHFGS
ncbi:hypothetical protein DBV15_09999, partial [Temnothorax longispinosus]